ncbi:hypothetical protein CPB85DRAFT_1319726 [Mucidula mucida]|nr:hypothetical protein CPB85DRAFT_1319726 [Mucidula mucida]
MILACMARSKQEPMYPLADLRYIGRQVCPPLFTLKRAPLPPSDTRSRLRRAKTVTTAASLRSCPHGVRGLASS